MDKKYIYSISVMCKDSPGIVAHITKVLYEENFNIEDISSTRLNGMFSMIMVIKHSKLFTLLQVKKMFSNLIKQLDLTISVQKVDDTKFLDDGKTFIISIYGADKPGIVYNTTQILSNLEINIIDLQTKISNREKNPIYIMIIEVIVPYKTLHADWIKQIKKISDTLKTDIHIREIETYEL